MKHIKPWLFRGLVILTLGFSMSIAFHPDVRSSVRSVFVAPQRIVLSTVFGQFTEDGSFHIVKVKTREGIIVEIYRALNRESVMNLIDKIELPQHKDAYFTFNGASTNLAIDDIDGDNKLELLVPSFDQSLVAHLNVFKFDNDAKRFEQVQPTEIQ